MILSLLCFAGIAAFNRTCWYLPKQAKIDQQIVIEGNQVSSKTQICQALNLPTSTHDPLYSLNPQKLDQEIEKLSIIKRAFVRRYALPRPQLKIAVMEEFPWASLYIADSEEAKYVIAQSGRLIAIADFPAIPQPALKIYAKDADSIKLNASKVAYWTESSNLY